MPSPPLLLPPLRFSTTDTGIYRGSYPHPSNLPFLRRQKLKTIISLTPKPLETYLSTEPSDQDQAQKDDPHHIAGKNAQITTWCRDHGITLIHLPVEAGKTKKELGLSTTTARSAVNLLLDLTNHPIYIHCLNGCEITGLVIACLRKVQGWSLPSAMHEYGRYALAAGAHTSFLEGFDVGVVRGDGARSEAERDGVKDVEIVITKKEVDIKE
ncbi:protein-tyrosine-phosphatase [Saitoella coloradoensis]